MSAGFHTRPTRSLGRVSTRAGVISLALLMLFVAGCDGLNSRRAVRRGNDEFKAGKYEEAIKSFDEAIKLEPGLAIAHHNLGLTYDKLRLATVDPDKTKEYGDAAALNFGVYLKTDPKNSLIRNKMTQIWVDSDNFEKALDYWADQLKAQPDNQEVMNVLSGINFKAQRWEKSLEWITKSIEVSKTEENRRGLYVQIGRRCRQLITNREKYVGEERLKISDICIPLLQTGIEGDPKNAELPGMINIIFGIRALSQGASFAAAIDKASGQDQDALRRVLIKEAKAAQEAANPTPTAPAADGSANTPSGTPSEPAPTAPSDEDDEEAAPDSGTEALPAANGAGTGSGA